MKRPPRSLGGPESQFRMVKTLTNCIRSPANYFPIHFVHSPSNSSTFSFVTTGSS